MKMEKRIHILVTVAPALVVMAALVAGCGVRRAMLSHGAVAASQVSEIQEPVEYRVQPADELDIKFFFNPELNETVFVRPDGKISLQLIDDVQAAGLTPSELDQKLTQLYAQELRKPEVTVIVKSFMGQRVYVGGEVGTPGLINLAAGMTALQAVINAGGFLDTAKPDGVIVIRKGPDNSPIPIEVDLKAAIDGATEGNILLQPSDVVYVPKTWIAKANLFVKQYVADLFLYRGVSLGFSYRLNDPGD